MLRSLTFPRISLSLLSLAMLAMLAVAALLCSRPAAAQSLVSATITDPAFNNMNAVTLNIPAGWKLQGIMMRSPCTSGPLPTFRAYAPDGLSEFRAMPTLGWQWETNSRFWPKNNCLPLTGKMTAAEFLDKYVQMIPGGVHVIGPMPIDDTFHKRAQSYADFLNDPPPGRNAPPPGAANPNHPLFTADAAALHIQTVNGTFVIDQRLRVQLECQERPSGFMQGGTCWARVDVVRAPKGKFDALVALIDSHNLIAEKPTPEWFHELNERTQQEGQARLAEGARQAAANSAILQKQHEDFMAASQRNHQAFMAQQESSFRTHEAQLAQSESSFHSSMNNANNAMNARSTAASDWVDYALDQQTVAGQGGTAKVSSGYSQTWSSTVGNKTTWYQTNDPNTNPNGVLPGNWTQDTKVHGNGQPQ
jgi:hypothetical protein